jgi:hypothetical protein
MRLAFLWWKSGFVDALEASGDAIVRRLIHVRLGIDVGVEASFSALADGLELDAQGFDLLGVLMAEFGPAEGAGSQAELGGVEEVAVMFAGGKDPVTVGVGIGDGCGGWTGESTCFGRGRSTAGTVVPSIGATIASATASASAAGGHGRLPSFRGEGIGEGNVGHDSNVKTTQSVIKIVGLPSLEASGCRCDRMGLVVMRE